MKLRLLLLTLLLTAASFSAVYTAKLVLISRDTAPEVNQTQFTAIDGGTAKAALQTGPGSYLYKSAAVGASPQVSSASAR